MSNAAVAIILAPIGVFFSFSITGPIDPKPFLVAICFRINGFYDTIGYQTNLMVYPSFGENIK